MHLKRFKHFETRGIIVNKVKCKQRLRIWKHIWKESTLLVQKNQGEYDMESLWKVHAVVQGSKMIFFISWVYNFIMDYRRADFSITTIFKVATTYKYTKPHIPHLPNVAEFFSPLHMSPFNRLWFTYYAHGLLCTCPHLNGSSMRKGYGLYSQDLNKAGPGT